MFRMRKRNDKDDDNDDNDNGCKQIATIFHFIYALVKFMIFLFY